MGAKPLTADAKPLFAGFRNSKRKIKPLPLLHKNARGMKTDPENGVFTYLCFDLFEVTLGVCVVICLLSIKLVCCKFLSLNKSKAFRIPCCRIRLSLDTIKI